ncbi:cobaltochelatase subunit CobN [Gammaproteobacteria bacterium 42_54_T18]|nr:cobaltochelatase subunit CobN [Gammaproteobacteria bacterium 42_54_T18]
MHLLAAKPGGFCDEEGIIDLQQTPADVIILSAQDTLINILANTAKHYFETVSIASAQPEFTLRLANILHLTKPAAFDLYFESVLKHAKLIIVSLLGGENYWPYGIEQLRLLAEQKQCDIVFVPGDDAADPQLMGYSTFDLCRDVGPCDTKNHDIWRYLREAGAKNINHFFRFIHYHWFENKKGSEKNFDAPEAIPNTLLFDAVDGEISLAQWKARYKSQPTATDPIATGLATKSTVALIFYKSHLQSGNTAAFEEFSSLLHATGLIPLTIVVNSLKDTGTRDRVSIILEQSDAQLVINTTGFSVCSQENASLSSLPTLDKVPYHGDLPIIQAIASSSSKEDWLEYSQGLRARDMAMNVALPELDGRIISRAITFKETRTHSDLCQVDQIIYQLHKERAQFVALLAQGWASLRNKQDSEKRIALLLANYPTKEGRIGNGVGLDTPASVITILQALAQQGYSVGAIPSDGDKLIDALLESVTNDLDTLSLRKCNQSITVEDYLGFFHTLPEKNQSAVIERWGQPQQSPKYRAGRLMISGIRLNNVFVGIQPARGYNVDAAASYHDPDLVPPHDYLAFYYWLRKQFNVDAVAHIGKHGNLEWLPGKAVALSNTCWPDAIFGPLPHLYPFIVNDPGEGAQAKRRIQAVIIDHLMPPMARAETYGDLAALENLVDEYYQALGLDPLREEFLRNEILSLLGSSDIAKELPSYHPSEKKSLDTENSTIDNSELNQSPSDSDISDTLLGELDAYLCELKEAQIRNGLHRFGQLPINQEWSETLVSLLRLPRGTGAKDIGLLHAACEDLKLKNTSIKNDGNTALFNPLTLDPSAPWIGGKPKLLLDLPELSNISWRTEADTRERLESLSLSIVERFLHHDKSLREPVDRLGLMGLPRTQALFKSVVDSLLPAFEACGPNEIDGILDGFSGRFVQPGPSGAPTRGRLDTLPTGRNFYSIDNRSIPTPAAWELGKKSALKLIERHLQEHGEYPTQLGMSVWGTSTMRTGGDDIAQAMALMGVKPIRSPGSNRVVDFEVIPSFLMSHPRVDVTLRISGFFRDAFPQVINLFDAAINALYEHQEPGHNTSNNNPIRDAINNEISELLEDGIEKSTAIAQAKWRIFGSKPGSYGAGLQGLIDERLWDTKEDLAQAYINWGGYAYSQADKGKVAFQAFASRLSEIDVIIQNQDNREHDLLDSDDYYQFQGGMANAVKVMSDNTPAVYHGDHSNPANPAIKTLKEELNKVIRSRALNPKWMKAMQQHGYKGAFEMAATVDYLFAYDATTDLIDDYQYQSITEQYLFDEKNRAFLESVNPNAMKEMAERLYEAIQRGMWSEPGDSKQALEDMIIDIENTLETQR